MKSKCSFLFLAVLLLAGFFSAGCDDKEGLATAETSSTLPAAVPVSVVEIKPVPMRDVIYLPGTTEAWQDV